MAVFYRETEDRRLSVGTTGLSDRGSVNRIQVTAAALSCLTGGRVLIIARNYQARQLASDGAFKRYLWHSSLMKALKSKLASQLLADPQASDQLLDFLLSKTTRLDLARSGGTGQFVVRGKDGKSTKVNATVVPKASKAA